MSGIVPFQRPGFLKRWWYQTLSKYGDKISEENSSSSQRQIRITEKNDRSTLHAWLYLLKKVNFQQIPISVILSKTILNQLNTLFQTVHFNWFDEKCNYYKYLPEIQLSNALVTKRNLNINYINAFFTYVICAMQKRNEMTLDYCHIIFCTIFNFLTGLPDEISLKGCVILVEINRSRVNSVPVLQALLNTVVSHPNYTTWKCTLIWELLTNICIQFIRRGYDLSDFKNDKYYLLPVFFIAIKIAIQNNFKSLLEIFLEWGGIDWNSGFEYKKEVWIPWHDETSIQDPPEDLNSHHEDVDPDPDEEYTMGIYDGSYTQVFLHNFIKPAKFVVSRDYPCLNELPLYFTRHTKPDKMCERFENYVKVLELLMEKGMPVPNHWKELFCCKCLFCHEFGFEFLKKLQWAGADVMEELRERWGSDFGKRGPSVTPCIEQIEKYTEWFERQELLSLRLLYLAKVKVKESLNIDVMEREIKSGLLPVGFKKLMFNYQPTSCEEKKSKESLWEKDDDEEEEIYNYFDFYYDFGSDSDSD